MTDLSEIRLVLFDFDRVFSDDRVWTMLCDAVWNAKRVGVRA